LRFRALPHQVSNPLNESSMVKRKVAKTQRRKGTARVSAFIFFASLRLCVFAFKMVAGRPMAPTFLKLLTARRRLRQCSSIT